MYSGSFGISELEEQLKTKYKNGLKNFNYISVREDAGKKIIEKLTNRKDIDVLIDPTLLLTTEEWDKLIQKPKMLKTEKLTFQ